MEKITYEDLIEYLKEHVDVLKDMVNEVNGYNGELEDYNWYDNNEYFYDDFFSSKDEVARAVYYGGSDYCYTDEYVRLDAYGNLETTSDIESDMIDGAEEILDAFLEEYKNGNVELCIQDEFNEMLKKYDWKESEEDK